MTLKHFSGSTLNVNSTYPHGVSSIRVCGNVSFGHGEGVDVEGLGHCAQPNFGFTSAETTRTVSAPVTVVETVVNKQREGRNMAGLG